jgi:hypothetical protein
VFAKSATRDQTPRAEDEFMHKFVGFLIDTWRQIKADVCETFSEAKAYWLPTHKK